MTNRPNLAECHVYTNKLEKKRPLALTMNSANDIDTRMKATTPLFSANLNIAQSYICLYIYQARTHVASAAPLN